MFILKCVYMLMNLCSFVCCMQMPLQQPCWVKACAYKFLLKVKYTSIYGLDPFLFFLVLWLWSVRLPWDVPQLWTFKGRDHTALAMEPQKGTIVTIQTATKVSMTKAICDSIRETSMAEYQHVKQYPRKFPGLIILTKMVPPNVQGSI